MPKGTALKVVEVPPGPPVLSTLLAEVYGPDPETRRATATKLKEVFESVPFIVDVDDSFRVPAERLRVSIDQDKLEFFRVEQKDVYDTIQAYLSGVPVGYSLPGRRPPSGRNRHRLAEAGTLALAAHALHARARERHPRQPLDRRAWRRGEPEEGARLVPDLPPQRQAGGDGDGRTGGQLRGADLRHARGSRRHRQGGLGAGPEARRSCLHGQPNDDSKPMLLWDGEWEVTYVTFRDIGAAFGIAILGIYFIVVGQFGSFKLPLVILTPVPLTLIGIMLGHWMFGAPFTATSMIGFIALAGIIVRNSILLVDFIQGKRGTMPLRQVLLGGGRDPVQADPSDGACRHDRRGGDPRRPDLPGARDLAPVRACLIDASDGARHPGDLCGSARQEDGPPPHALNGGASSRYCPHPGCSMNVAAPAIAADASANGWSVGRTSLKTRNPKNAPDVWEKRVLDEFDAAKNKGADATKLERFEVVEKNGVRTFRYMKAIPAAEPCLTCHGQAIKEPVKAKLAELYPFDRATGYKEGDIRGAFTLSKPLP